MDGRKDIAVAAGGGAGHASERVLVERAADGDAGAFSRLVEAHWDRLVRLARSVVGDADAEDAVQDALVRAWSKLPGLRRPDAFSTWVARVVLRRCFRYRRRRPRLTALDDAPEPRHHSGVDAGLDVERLLAALAPRQRAVMHLTAVEGLADSEIAELMGITPASVRSHRRRARQALEARMADFTRGRTEGADAISGNAAADPPSDRPMEREVTP